MRNNKLISLYYHTNSIYNRIFSFAKRMITSNPGDTLINGLLWYYKLDEATSIPRADASPNQNTLSVTGTVTSVAGIIDNSALFPGVTGNFLSKSFESIYDFSATDFSVAGWFQTGDLSSNQEIIYIGQANRAAAQMVFDIRFFNSNDKIEFTVSDGSSTENLTSSIVVPINTFVFFCIRYNFTTKLMEIRINGGVFISSTNPNGALHNPGAQELVVGSHLTGNVADCCIDEIIAANRLWTDTEVNFLYNNGLANRPNFTVLMTDPDDNTLTDPDGVELDFLGG